MRTALGLFLASVVAVALAWWVSLLPGAVTATVAGTTITTSTPFAVLLLVILFAVLYIVIRLLVWMVSVPHRVKRRRLGRSRVKGELAVNRALIALAADDAGGARREADRSRRLLGDTPLTLLIAAQAGRQAGRADEATALYEQLAERPDARLLGLRGLMRIAVERQDWERAAALAAHAEKAHPGAAWLRNERRYMAQQTGEWHEALRLAAPENKAALATSAAEHEKDPKASLALSKQAFEADPGLAPAAVAYATRLRENGHPRRAQDALRQAWSTRPQPDIAQAFVADAGDKLAQARETAVLVRSNPDHIESYVAIVRAALDAGLAGEARRQLERARAAGLNQRRLWSLAADIAVIDGKPDEAQDALRHLADADPDPAWRCTACGTQYESWRPVCDNCHTTGSLHWLQPGDVNPKPGRRSVPALGAEGLAT